MTVSCGPKKWQRDRTDPKHIICSKSDGMIPG
jgi:hypothetical protein